MLGARPLSIEPEPRDLVAPTIGAPPPRGPVSAWLLHHLARPVHDVGPMPAPVDDPVTGEDSALALYLCYELHYRGVGDADDAWEWEPSLLMARRELERRFEHRLTELVGYPPVGLSPAAVVAELEALADPPDGPSVSAFVAAEGTLEQLQELAIHRSAYQLKEADPHTWGIPRLTGGPKAALVDIQIGEYGEGRPEAVHATLFGDTLVELGLDRRYGAYLDAIPAIALSTCNLVTFFGLHRRWRAALAGHLALFEMCSVGPMGRYAAALERFGLGDRATRFYTEHVVADERHQVVGLHDLAEGLARDEPFLAGEIVFGARCLDRLEAMFADHVLTSWAAGRSSLRTAA
jgi:hypothetical protein